MTKQRDDLLVWMDLETTGLLPAEDTIVEVSIVLTDAHLEVVAQLEKIVIHTERERFDRVPFVRNMHTVNGLIEESVASTVTLAEAERMALDFLKQYVVKQSSPLCGSSVYFDRMFLKKHMLELDEYFHHRLIDVSAIKELTKRWYPSVYGFVQDMKVKKAHRAHDDILESIKELRVYKDTFFKIAQ